MNVSSSPPVVILGYFDPNFICLGVDFWQFAWEQLEAGVVEVGR
jgi:hypothetical protein